MDELGSWHTTFGLCMQEHQVRAKKASSEMLQEGESTKIDFLSWFGRGWLEFWFLFSLRRGFDAVDIYHLVVVT